MFFRLSDALNGWFLVCSFSVDLCFFTVPCPESRSEALRFVPGVVEVLAFFSVACNFFQLLERLVGSIPAVSRIATVYHMVR